MKASETTFQSLIEGTKQYVVPLFQRPYSWQKEQWSALWDDLADLCQEENPRSHFIGSIVTLPSVSVPEGVNKYLLIDGQQRLTTIFILLSLLRDQAKASGDDELAEEISQTLLVNPFKKGNDRYKLLPTQDDRAPARAIIGRDGEPAPSQLQGAYEFFVRKLKQSKLDSKTLKQVITNNLIVVSIVLDQDDNPYLVFESLNAKGRPLSQADLIRNYFFMRIHVDQQEGVYQDLWKPMQDSLGENLAEFIRHYLMKAGTRVNQSEVYLFLKGLVGDQGAIERLRDLALFASYYKRLIYPENETDPQIAAAIERLNRIEVTTAYPFLLNCYHDYLTLKRISRDEFLETLRLMENYLIRRFVCNIPTNQISKIFSPLYSQVEALATGGFCDRLKAVLQTKGYPKDLEFRSRLRDSRLYGAGDRILKTKLILEAMERSFGHKEEVPFGKLSIEHIMPQTLSDQWRAVLGADWEATHELFLHTLGNLTLTAYNPELSNADFDAKKRLLAESHLELNKYFHDVPGWGANEIAERADGLATLAISIWPYFGDEGSQEAKKTVVTGTTPREVLILGQSFPVKTWREVLERTMDNIADLEPDKFSLIEEQFPRFVGRDSNRFRRAGELRNGRFIEVHLSAQDIWQFCSQATEAVGLTSEEWSVKCS